MLHAGIIALAAVLLSVVLFAEKRENRALLVPSKGVLSAMVACACSVFERGDLPWEARIMVMAGAITFYLSDVFVARDRFVKNEFLNRALGLPTYYTAQFLLAFSTALL